MNLRCDSHGAACDEILAQVERGYLVIRAKRHGEMHELVVDLIDLVAEWRRADGSTVPPKRVVEPQAARRPSESRADPCRTS
jgi:hypothetical protein